MQAVGGGVKADVGGNHARRRTCIKTRRVGYLVDIAALAQTAQKIRLKWTHQSRTLCAGDKIVILHWIIRVRPQSAAAGNAESAPDARADMRRGHAAVGGYPRTDK